MHNSAGVLSESASIDTSASTRPATPARPIPHPGSTVHAHRSAVASLESTTIPKRVAAITSLMGLFSPTSGAPFIAQR